MLYVLFSLWKPPPPPSLSVQHLTLMFQWREPSTICCLTNWKTSPNIVLVCQFNKHAYDDVDNYALSFYMTSFPYTWCQDFSFPNSLIIQSSLSCHIEYYNHRSYPFSPYYYYYYWPTNCYLCTSCQTQVYTILGLLIRKIHHAETEFPFYYSTFFRTRLCTQCGIIRNCL